MCSSDLKRVLVLNGSFCEAPIIKKAKDDAEKLLSEKEKECAVYEAAEIKKAKDTAEVIVTEAVKEAQRYADGLKKQSAEKLSEAVGIVKDTLLK